MVRIENAKNKYKATSLYDKRNKLDNIVASFSDIAVENFVIGDQVKLDDPLSLETQINQNRPVVNYYKIVDKRISDTFAVMTFEESNLSSFDYQRYGPSSPKSLQDIDKEANTMATIELPSSIPVDSNRPAKLTKQYEEAQLKEIEKSKFYNLSLTELLQNTADVFVVIIKDIFSGNFKEIFTRDDRLIYIGIYFIVIAVFIAMISLIVKE